jgi:DNA polymerase-4
VRLKLRWPDFSTHSRQVTLQQSTDQDGVIFANVSQLFHGLWQRGKAVRLLGVGASGLSFQARQLSLWDTPNERERRLLQALDELRQRFGEEAVQRARSLGKNKPDKHLPAKDTR